MKLSAAKTREMIREMAVEIQSAGGRQLAVQTRAMIEVVELAMSDEEFETYATSRKLPTWITELGVNLAMLTEL